MDQRRYDQFCALATALDHLGDRWTMLVIRELLLGPRRYSDIRDGLPGIASNLLASRLHALEADGIVSRRRLPPPAASTVYELTDLGRDVEPALLALMRWGARWMTTPAEGIPVHANWFALALKSLLDPEDLAGIHGTFEIRSGEEVIQLDVANDRLNVEEGRASRPDAQITADPRTLFRIGSGNSTLAAEVAAGRAAVVGSADSVQLLGRVLRFR